MLPNIDRLPAKPHRYAVYDDNHNFIRYEYHERADEPIVEGSPLNKAKLDEFLAASGETSGTASALTLAQPGFLLKDGATVRIKLHTDIAEGATLDIEGTGAKAIKLHTLEEVESGSCKAGAWVQLIYSSASDCYILQGGAPLGSGSGVPPLDVKDLSITANYDRLTIKWRDPDDLVLNGTVVSKWAGTKLVRKAGSYPKKPSDGVLLLDSTVKDAYAENGFVDSGLAAGETYYYQLFPYSNTGAVNLNETNRISGTTWAYKIYGVQIDLTNPNPETACVYTDDAVGMTPGAAWDDTVLFRHIRPCVLKDGVVQYYLDPNNLSKKIDGTNADITSGNDGDVMVEIPKIGYSIDTSGNTLTVKITDNPNNPNFKYYAHTRKAEGDRSKLYIGAYLGWASDGKLRSLSEKTPTAYRTIGTFRTLARANGSGYDLVSFYPLTLLQCLYLIKYKNLNSQTALGRGYAYDYHGAATNTGGTNQKGIDFGETTGKQQMCFLNIEDFWGNLNWWIDGLYSDGNRNIKTAFQNFNDTGSGYTNRGQGATSDIDGFMSKPQGTSETGFIVKEDNGSGTTYFADRAYLSAGCLPFFGGSWDFQSYAGAFYLRVDYTASSSYSYCGARLMYL